MKRIIYFSLCTLILFLPSQALAAKKVPILIYHSIDEFTGHGSEDLYVHPKNFEEQMTYLRDHGYTLLTFERWQEINNVKKPIFITFDDGYKNNLNAFAIFKKLAGENFKPTGTIFVISDFVGRSNRLSVSDLKMMSDSGFFSIQSHTATHPDLTKINNYEDELKKAKDKIQQMTGKPVIALAYPYGKYNRKVIAETKKYYKYGLTTDPGAFSEKGNEDELFTLPRTYITYTTTIEQFAKIVNGE